MNFDLSLQVGIIISATMYNDFRQGIFPYLLPADFALALTMMYNSSAMILFVNLCEIASDNLKQMKLRIKVMRVEEQLDVVDRLHQLKEYHGRNVEFIYQINRCFGIIVLLQILDYSLKSLHKAVSLLVAITNMEPWHVNFTTICYFCFFTFNIIIITFGSEKIREKVSSNC